jgi:hypothetical protein
MWDKVVIQATPIQTFIDKILIINELFVAQPYFLPTLCIENKRTGYYTHSLVVDSLITSEQSLQD